MNREDARAVAERLLSGTETLSWTETSAENPLWAVADELRRIEVRWMKTGRYLRRRVHRTRAQATFTWETRHSADWLAMTLERAHLSEGRLHWALRGGIVLKSKDVLARRPTSPGER